MADVNKCQSKSSTSDQPRVKGKFVKKGTASRSNRLKYFNKVNYDLSKTRGTEHSYSREADDYFNTQTADHDVYYDADIALVETVAEDSDISWRDGRRIVELKHMADQMFCIKCSHPLHLSHIVDEKISGLGSFLHIQCPSPQCLYINTVTTGKRNEKGVFDINNKATIAMIHSGMGPTHLQNFLAACNIPPPNQSTIIRREKEMSKSLLSQAKQSCDRARDKEKNSTESTSMEASFDAAWQTRGSGCQYNSNTGHSSMIGPNTDKVIDFDYRTRLCSICTHHFSRRETVPPHVCNSNWEGSSKAMESDMAASMLRRLKDDGFEISAIHADNDSTTAARLKAEFQSLEKRCDKNHLKKNITKQLYSLSKSHKQLKQEGVICYITKCYMHPLSIKRQSEEEVGRKLDMVVPHIFGDHNLCSTSWCAYHRNPKSYRMKYLPDGKPLNDEMLREALNRITLSLKRILPQLVCLGSTQSNENFNNMVASKAPKNRAYGGTTSLASRVSAAVLQKNEGYTYISQVNEDALLSPGVVSKLHGIRMDKKKLWNKKQQSSIAFKRRRLLLKKRKQKREYSLHLREGNTYGSNIETAAEVDIESIPGKLDPEKGEFIMFDIETTGLSRDSDIVQLSAFDGITEFNVYIRPNQPISKNATAISGITFSFEKNTVYYNGREVESTDLRLGLLKFLEYLQSHANPILVGHNIMSYDIPVLCHKLHECSMLSEFIQCVYGCADTLKLAHKLYKKEDVGNYKQSTLVNILLGKSYAAHNSLEDVKILHELFTKKLTCYSEDLFPFHIHILQKSFKTMVEKKAMSVATSRKIAGSGLGFQHMMLAHKRDELIGVKTLLGEHEPTDPPNRQPGRFAGFSLYVSDIDLSSGSDIKRSTRCYKDGPQLPPLNFTTVCKVYGRYVIYYNERFDGVTYPEGYETVNVFTELCEVVVKGCQNESYGSMCNMTCPTNCKEKQCDIEYGKCSMCELGFYGNHCNSRCPSNCKENVCHMEQGDCFGCNDGWEGISCSIKCREGWYGLNCSQQCVGHCRNGATCNHVTGQCDGGCDAGWTGHQCKKECDDGTYGYNCVNNCSGHCLNDSPCNKQTGHCDRGCNPGYIGDECSTRCLPRNYGNDCKEKCSGNCMNNEPCDHVSGECKRGCRDGYFGKLCTSDCEEGYFGKNCSLVCSPNCKTCRHTDGFCTCKKGWMGYNCTKECFQSFGEDCQNHCNHCINSTCDRFNGSCSDGCIEGEACSLEVLSNTLSDSIPSIIGVTVGICAVLIIGTVFAVFLLRFRKQETKMTNKKSFAVNEMSRIPLDPLKKQFHLSDGSQRIEHTSSFSETTYALPERTNKGPPTNKYISVRNIKAQIANMSVRENAGFRSEYQDIPRGELHESLEAKKPENKVKNRYTTIYPYDHSRIVLKTITTGEGDYINANYIENSGGQRYYIATQGPKPKTIADFWKMIWQEGVCNIVCLTNLKEGTKNKCAQYWPSMNDKLQGGTLTIRHLEEKAYAEYTIRRFKIHNKTTRTDRHVTMFHYTTWSDHGVADPLSLVMFHRHVIRATDNSAGKYTVVHCSAGVGRTGTYIALDSLYREGERTGKINVPMYVRTMRKDRMNMIQGDEQYKLLYLALMEAFSGPSRCMTTEKFVGAYQEQTCYANCGDVVQKSSQSSEFKELLSLRKEYTQQDYTSGRAQILANYTQSVLPVEEFMCHLTYIKGHNTYYNAVLLQSYLEKDSLISAQYPLPDNTEDFLRLIKDFNARVVVFLCPLKDIESTPAWFPTDNQSKLNGHFFIKNISTIKASNVLMTKLNIQPQGFSEMNITVIECPTWREGKGAADKRVLLDVIKAVKTEKSDQEGRIVVLSSDGATRCGPFFVVYNVLEQISVDREVDIFTTTRQLQVRRPEFVSTLEEYQLCYDTVAEYLLNDCVYGNC